MVPNWVRGKESAAILSPVEKPLNVCLGLGIPALNTSGFLSADATTRSRKQTLDRMISISDCDLADQRSPPHAVAAWLFTLHGSCTQDFESIAKSMGLAGKGWSRKYRVAKENAGEIPRELRLLGISDSTLSPDHDGLSIDLKRDFKRVPIQSRADDHIPVVEQLPQSRKN
jgi:hypothetical protein